MRLIIAGFIIFRKEIVPDFTKCTILEACVNIASLSHVTKHLHRYAVTDQ